MSALADLEKFTGQAFLKILSVLMLIVPGAAVLYHFNKPLFSSLDVFKVMLASLVFSLPLFLVMLAVVFVSESISPSDTKDEGDFFIYTFMAALGMNGVIFLWLLISSFQAYTQAEFIKAVLWSSLAVAAVFIGIAVLERLKKK